MCKYDYYMLYIYLIITQMLTLSNVDPRTTALSYSWHLLREKKSEKGAVRMTSSREHTWSRPVISHRARDFSDHCKMQTRG